ncbi:MAG: hypothetical protein U5L95_05555 [Candidatus Saccharibacteria bacterium]|nr:hypothetical protein [Candidatus Saccharibacteria bacterium]
MKIQIPGSKRALVDKANTTVVVSVAIAAVIVTFCLVASKALWDESRFLTRVIEKKETARDQLIANVEATDSLVDSYEGFVREQPNVIDGNIDGDGERDGDNARIVLDALPSKYDHPALATSIEKILGDQGLTVESIQVLDQQANEAGQASQQIDPGQIDQQQGDESGAESVSNNEPIEMPFEFSVNLSPDASRQLFRKLQRSIRPMHVTQFSINSQSESSIQLTVSAKTYYQPKSGVQITKETVK